MFHECRHIKTNGERCHAAALNRKPYCYFHMNLHRMHNPRLADSQRFQLPPIEDNASILLALGQVIKTLNSPYADARRAGLMLYALQIAAQLTNRKEQAKPSQSVRNLYSPSEEELDFSSAVDNGIDMLAPDTTVCDPPKDCPTCPRRDTCVNKEPQEQDADKEDNSEHDDEDQKHEDREHEDQQRHNADDDESEEIDDESLNRIFLHASAAASEEDRLPPKPPLREAIADSLTCSTAKRSLTPALINPPCPTQLAQPRGGRWLADLLDREAVADLLP